jgi:membrane dipeptidase
MKNIPWVIFAVVLLSSCQSLEEKAAKIHDKVLTIDSHSDTPLRFVNDEFKLDERHDPKKDGSKYDFIRMKEGGLDAAFFAVFIGQGQRDSIGNAKAIERTKLIFDSVHSALRQYPELAGLALTPEDAYRLEKEGKRAIYLGIENGYALGTDLKLIDKYYQLGTRYITLCHTANNDICDSSTDNDTLNDNGLSPFGEQVVDKMNDLGIMVDISHASDQSFFDVIERSKAPIIASHSCARAIRNHPRNLTDEQLRALAKNGGVIQMCILSDYVKEMPTSPQRDSARTAFRKKHYDWDNYTEEQRREGIRDWMEMNLKYPPNLATVSDVVDHIDHIVEIAGIDHVGIGTDFDGGGGVADCYDTSEMGNITLELVKRGYSEDEIRKIWGGNFMRVFREVEKVKKKG